MYMSTCRSVNQSVPLERTRSLQPNLPGHSRPPLRHPRLYKVSQWAFVKLNPIGLNQIYLNLMVVPCGIPCSFQSSKSILRVSWSPRTMQLTFSISYNIVKVKRNNLPNFVLFWLPRQVIKAIRLTPAALVVLPIAIEEDGLEASFSDLARFVKDEALVVNSLKRRTWWITHCFRRWKIICRIFLLQFSTPWNAILPSAIVKKCVDSEIEAIGLVNELIILFTPMRVWLPGCSV